MGAHAGDVVVAYLPVTVVAAHAATFVCGHHRFDSPTVRTHPR
ncbi:hypothetical protein [Actinoplanes lobatus]|uniref:Uncharacterized protein n=1 Tax=Actinoplanes lobatus TaxID=113568 RepID=A0A7W7HII4_9ACTN|nr:hypothetical protein [Actinoplanes lobatus]MBB4751198.1 hypothetical protein [Actinoplanes lobatus]